MFRNLLALTLMSMPAFCGSIITPNAQAEVLRGRWAALFSCRHGSLSVRSSNFTSLSCAAGPSIGLTNTLQLRLTVEGGLFSLNKTSVKQTTFGNPTISARWNFASVLKPGRYHRLAIEPKLTINGGRPTQLFFYDQQINQQIQLAPPGMSPGADLVYSYGQPSRYITNVVAGYTRYGQRSGLRLGDEWRGTWDIEPMLKRFEGKEELWLTAGVTHTRSMATESRGQSISGTEASRTWGTVGLQYNPSPRVSLEVQYRRAVWQSIGPNVPRWSNEFVIALRILQ